MYKDIKDPIKVRLYDMKYTPFLASYIFFFGYFNAKLFLIFFDPNIATSEKIELLGYDDVCHWKPIVGALFYTLIFPFFQIGFYTANLWFDTKMNDTKQKVEARTLLSLEESKDIRYASKKLQDELDEYIKKFELAKKEYDEYKVRLETEYQEKNKKLETNFENRVVKATENLKNELIETQKKIAYRGSEIEQLKKQIDILNIQPQKLSKTISENFQKNGLAKMVLEAQNKQNEEFKKLILSIDEDEKIILKSFDENDSKMNKNQFKEMVFKNKNTKKVTSEKAIQSLVAKKIILEHFGDVNLTELGLRVVDELFRGEL